jgi:DUF971 family protein
MITPSKIHLNKDKNILSLTFEDTDYQLSSEFLRVYSPSAEVVGHGPGQEVLQVDKEQVFIKDIKPTGNYAIILFFSDEHDSGIYSWDYLHHLCTHQEKLWNEYLERLKKAGHKHSKLH